MLTLQSGYSENARLFANIWLFLFLILIFFGLDYTDGGPLLFIYFFTVFGLFVMPLRIVLDNLLVQIQSVISKDPSFDSTNVHSASFKAKQAKKVQLLFIVVVVLVLTGLIMPGKKAVKPVAVKPTEMVAPITKAELINQAKAAIQEAEDAKIALETETAKISE